MSATTAELFRLAAQHRARGDVAAEQKIYRDLVQREPRNATAWLHLGISLASAERFDEAVTALRETIALEPKNAPAHAATAYALSRLDRPADAERAARAAIALHPSPDAHLILAQALILQSKFAAAEASVREAMKSAPGHPKAAMLLGMALTGLDRFDEAEAAFAQALSRDPSNAETLFHHSRLRARQKRLADEIELLERALSLRPNYEEAHLSLGCAHLLAGDYARGFAHYEHRWSSKEMKPLRRAFAKPRWDGSPLAGRRILVHREQGFGDLFQFARFFPLLAERGAGKVIVEAQPSAADLIQSVEGVDEVITRSDASGDGYDLYVPLMSLPLALGITLQNLPARVPYLRVDRACIEVWRERLAHLPGRRIGIAWAGNREHDRDEHRSIRSSLLSPLASVPNVSYVSLQLPRDTRAKPEDLPLFDPTPDIKDFSDTAAIIENLDLVIGVDTALVHLAGALAKPVWTLIDFHNDWRWMLDGDDTPWYPTMRLFRQKTAGGWNEVIQRVSDELTTL